MPRNVAPAAAWRRSLWRCVCAQGIVWLRVVLSERYGPEVAEHFWRRLPAYLCRSDIWPVTSATRIALLCTSRSITAFNVS